MKAFAATLLLAATVSANYCYTDGCNCSGEYRQCYSLPRQTLNIPKCCGSSPTSPQAEVTSALRWTETDCEMYCQSTGAYFPGSGCDAKMGQSCDANTITAVLNSQTDSLIGASIQIGGGNKNKKPTNSQTVVYQPGTTTSVVVPAGTTKQYKVSGTKTTTTTTTTTKRQTSALRWTKSKCTDYCNAFGSYFPGSGCTTKMGEPCAAPITSALCSVGKQCNKYFQKNGRWAPGCCKNSRFEDSITATEPVTSALRWTNNNCRDFCLATGDYPNLSPCQRQMGEETCAIITAQYASLTASLMSAKSKYKVGSAAVGASGDGGNDSWNGNTMTGASVQTGGNTNCGKGCGTSINVNLGL